MRPPGLPCALTFLSRANDLENSGATRREIADAYLEGSSRERWRIAAHKLRLAIGRPG
jgi:hypothetical protein